MKKSVRYVAILFSFTASFSHSSDLLKKRNSGTLYALNSNGTLKWKTENLDGVRVSGAVVGSDETIYATGSGRVHAFDKDGNKLWE